VSALDFLSVSGTVGSGSFEPLARSAMDRRQRDAGATFEAREGWLVPVSLPGEDECLETVGVADLSHLAIFEVRPSDPMVKGDDIVWHRISDRRSLVLCPSTHAASVRADLGERFVLDLSGALSVIALVGPEAQTVLRRLTHLHQLPASGEVAHVSAHVLNVAQLTWIVFPQEFGDYLWEVVVDRAAALGGGPVGVDALLRSVAS
jgi:glycine cleavage system aminomethyltransferase T